MFQVIRRQIDPRWEWNWVLVYTDETGADTEVAWFRHEAFANMILNSVVCMQLDRIPHMPALQIGSV